MGKRQRLPSSDEEDRRATSATSSDEDPIKKKSKSKNKDKKDSKVERDKHDKKEKKEKEGKEKGKSEKKDKSDGKHKEGKTSRDEKAVKPDERKGSGEHKKAADFGSVARRDGDAAAPVTEAKKAKKNKKDKQPPPKEVVLSVGGEVFKDSARPFGVELDGSLVVDMADKGAEAVLDAGVQIGWRVLKVDGVPVPVDDVGVAAKRLREAEVRASKAGPGVRVEFLTEEPDRWRNASRKLKLKNR